VSVIGFKDSGKTSVAVGLISALERRGRQVMAIKHGHRFEVDTPGTDSWRLRHEGGARRVVLAGPEDMVVMGGWGSMGEPSVKEVVNRFVSDAEIVVVEGYKTSNLPKIEVYRTAAHPEPFYQPDLPGSEQFLALVTDAPEIEVPIPVLDLNAPDLSDQLADLVESKLLS
ncbi:uncharacterized protein METZ01_LOCUS118584, partial [marine metagenome]